MNVAYTFLADLLTEAEPPEDGILSRTIHQDERVKAVLFGFAELDQGDGVLELLLETLHGRDLVLKRRALAHDLLRGVGVVPEVGILSLGVQFREASLGSIPVKDASSAARLTAWSLLRGVGFQRAWLWTCLEWSRPYSIGPKSGIQFRDRSDASVLERRIVRRGKVDPLFRTMRQAETSHCSDDRGHADPHAATLAARTPTRKVGARH